MSQTKSRGLENFWVKETPSGTINGSNVTFTLSFTPVYTSTLDVYQDGIYLDPTTHYSISGTTLTMVAAPVVGQRLSVKYIKRT